MQINHTFYVPNDEGTKSKRYQLFSSETSPGTVTVTLSSEHTANCNCTIYQHLEIHFTGKIITDENYVSCWVFIPEKSNIKDFLSGLDQFAYAYAVEYLKNLKEA